MTCRFDFVDHSGRICQSGRLGINRTQTSWRVNPAVRVVDEQLIDWRI
jgi:hypothetical protein